MSVAFQYSITDEVSQALRQAQLILGDADSINKRLGRECAIQLREHFRQRESSGPRNRFGAPSSHFWLRIRESVGEPRVTADGVEVPIADPAINQKVFGGEIRKDKKMLAIAARTEAYNRSPRLFSDLRLIVFRSGSAALVKQDVKLEKGQRGIGRKFDIGSVFYWLVDSVRQDKDPHALPSDQLMAAALLRRLQAIFNRQNSSAS